MKQPRSILLYDSYKKQQVVIDPAETVIENTLKMYHCGPTVYYYQHIGNLQSTWLADMIKRTALMAGWNVEYVENITDVGHLTGDGDNGLNITQYEDKIEQAAIKNNLTVQDIVTKFSDHYKSQAAELHINLPENKLNPKASEYIERQLHIALTLLLDGRAYLMEDGIYYDSEANLDIDVPFPIVTKKQLTKKVVLFDFDGVLNKSNIAFQILTERFAITHEQILNFFKENTNIWRGKNDLILELNTFFQTHKINIDAQEFVSFWLENDLHIIQDHLDYMLSLKKRGYTVCLASNQEYYRAQYIRDHVSEIQELDYVFFGSEIGYIKYDIEYWNHVIKTLGVSPEEILLIDDQKGILAIAEQVGIDGLLYSMNEMDLPSLCDKVITSINYTGRDIINQTKNPSDFALWKFVPQNTLQKWRIIDYNNLEGLYRLIPQFEDFIYLWGVPGWHSECVAMILDILGVPKENTQRYFSQFGNQYVIDLHLGGEDHIDVHHKNEILQSESLGFHLSRFWVHNKFVLVDNKKMSKSLGNIYHVTGDFNNTGSYSFTNPPLDIQSSYGIVTFDPLAFRMLLLQQNYREQVSFTWDKLLQSQNRLFNIRKNAAFISSYYGDYVSTDIDQDLYDSFVDTITQDLKFNEALEIFDTQIEYIHKTLSEDAAIAPDLKLLIHTCIKVDVELFDLNIFPHSYPVDTVVTYSKMKQIAEKRLTAKNQKDYTLADTYRKEIQDNDFHIDDYQDTFGLWYNPSRKTEVL